MTLTCWAPRSIVILPLLLIPWAAAQTPLGTAITYQGRLDTGSSAAAGLHDFRLSLHDAFAGGAVIAGPVCNDNVMVVDGLFTLSIDFGPDAFNGDARWLEIGVREDAVVGNCATGLYQVLAPRQALRAAPYALKVPGIDGHSLDASDGSPVDALYVDTLGRVGIGTTVPLSPLTLRSNGAGNGLVHSDGFSAIATYLAGGGSGSGGWLGTITADPLHFFTNNSSPRMTVDMAGKVGVGTTSPGMSLEVTALSYYGAPAMGGSNGPAYAYLHISPTDHSLIWNQGHGMRFGTETSRGAGYVERMRIAADGNVGIGGETASTTRLRVLAPSSADQVGIFGDALGTNSIGVWGRADQGLAVVGTIGAEVPFVSNLPRAGVYGKSADTGVLGDAFAEGGVGVNGRTNNNLGAAGVLGQSLGAFGACRGVWGAVNSSDPLAYGVFSNGNMGATGTKPFCIDHPDDPTNKYLLHYATESPEVLNSYSGKVTLDAAGNAIVSLPDYFSRINRDPRYTLTAIGAPMPLLHVATEIDETALIAGAAAKPGEPSPQCFFRIAGGAPGGKVSWRVEALRNDRWVQRRGAPVEVDKPEHERGTYQHPELYDASPKQATNHRTRFPVAASKNDWLPGERNRGG